MLDEQRVLIAVDDVWQSADVEAFSSQAVGVGEQFLGDRLAVDASSGPAEILGADLVAALTELFTNGGIGGIDYPRLEDLSNCTVSWKQPASLIDAQSDIALCGKCD